MSSYVFESLMICRNLTLDINGLGFRGASSLFAGNHSQLFFFARARGPEPREGFRFGLTITRYENKAAEDIHREIYVLPKRVAPERGVLFLAAWEPDSGLPQGEYVVTMVLETGEQLTSSFEVEG
ncbi:MAG: hypothetical protein H6841_01790 [Planctomycetes bacterium]|nr:hypothetical protein [Planctomycetota bacterium]MCB9935567.1 hypothetical protein [Planctomycetota bacterium]